MAKSKRRAWCGVGMPAAMWLDEFGSQVWNAFGDAPFQVGSSVGSKEWRDVDVRLILSDDEYAALDIGEPREMGHNAKWAALCMAFAALGKAMTGLPIDFQIQQRTWATDRYPSPENPRLALGMVGLRFRECPREHTDDQQ